MKIEIQFQWYPEYLDVFLSNGWWYFTRKGVRYLIKWLSREATSDFNADFSVEQFIDKPAQCLFCHIIYETQGYYLPHHTPKISSIKWDNIVFDKQPKPNHQMDLSEKVVKLTDQILVVLEKYPETRNDDIELTIQVWKSFYTEFIIKPGEYPEEKWRVELQNLRNLPREDNIKRIRAKIQNDEGKFLPTKWDVAKKRKIAKLIWEEQMQKIVNQ